MENRNPIVEALKGVTDYIRNLEEDIAIYEEMEEHRNHPAESGECTKCGKHAGLICKFRPFANSYSVTMYLCDECRDIVCTEYEKFWNAVNQKGVE